MYVSPLPIELVPITHTAYTLSAARALASSSPLEILSVSTTPNTSDPKIDVSTTVSLRFPHDITSTLYCSFQHPPLWGLIPRLPEIKARVECEGGTLELYNFVLPTMYHWIKITEKGTGKTRYEKVYKFKNRNGMKDEEYWTTCVVCSPNIHIS